MKVVNHLFEKRHKNFGIGQHIQSKRDLTHFVKLPHYLAAVPECHVPPATNQFTQALGHQIATQMLSWLTGTDQR